MTGPARTAATRRRPHRTRLVPTGEGLEVRRLLATIIDPWSVSDRAGGENQLDPAAQFTTTATGRTDLYVLAPTGVWPSATIALQWTFGPMMPAGRVIVSDGSTLVLLDAPVDGPEPFNNSVGIPTSPGQNNETALLSLKISFSGSLTPGDSPQSYRIDAYFIPPPQQSPQLIEPPDAQPASPPPKPTSEGAAAGHTAPRTFTASAFLPILPRMDDEPRSPEGPPAIPVGPAPTLPPPGTPATPVSPGRPVGSGIPAPSVVGLTPNWSGVTVPILLPDSAPGRVATVVGPLPLGPSVEDGGILAQTRGPAAVFAVAGYREIRTVGATGMEGVISSPTPGSSGRPADLSWIMAPPSLPRAESSAALPFPVELAATGVAFLPPIAPAPPLERPTVAASMRPEPQSEPEPEPGQGPRRSRLPAFVAAALVGSTTLMVHLARGDQGRAVGWRRPRSPIAASVGRGPRSRSARPAR